MNLQTPKKHLLFLILLMMGLAGLNFWAWSVMDDRRSAAEQRQRDVAFCQQLADRIKRLKDKPLVAGSREIELTELSKRIEQTAVQCQIPAQSLVSISPEAARRADDGGGTGGESVYLEKPTTLLFSGVQLPELARFLYLMSSGPSAMQVREIRLSAPREQETSDRWTAEVKLSYLIYAPRNDSDKPPDHLKGEL